MSRLRSLPGPVRRTPPRPARPFLILLVMLSAASPAGALWREFALASDRSYDTVILEALDGATLDERLEILTAVGEREDPFIGSYIESFLLRHTSRPAESEHLMRVLLETAFPRTAALEQLAGRVAPNHADLLAAASRLATFADPQLCAAIVRLIPLLPGGLSDLLGTVDRLVDRLAREDGHLDPREKFCWDYWITVDELGAGPLRKIPEDAREELRLQFAGLAQQIFDEKSVRFSELNRDKLDAILPYRFHLALENCVQPNYWTEKLIDAYLGWAYPVYLGCPNIDDYLPRDSLMSINGLDVDAAAARIAELLDAPLTPGREAALIEARRRVLDVYSPFAWMAHWVEQLYQPGLPVRAVTLRSHKAFRNWLRGYLFRVRSQF